MNEVKAAIVAFVKAGDNNDVKALEDILHPDFQNIQDGFFDETGIFVFSKSDYTELIRTKKFGGSPRSIVFHAIEQSGNMAIAQVQLESPYLIFRSWIVCVQEKGVWKIINNTPKIEVRHAR